MHHEASPDHISQTMAGLRSVIIASEQLRRAFVVHYAVGASELVAMSHVRLHQGLNPHELADRIGLTPSTVTSLLDRLQTADLVQRSAHPTDRRMTILTLTAAGEEILAHADESLGAAIGHLDPDGLPVFAAGLDRLADALTEQATEVSDLPPARDV